MMMRTALLVLITMMLAACAGAQTRSAFDKSLEKYNDLVRWHDLDRAAFFAAPGIVSEFGKRAEEAKKVKVYDYEVIDTKYDEKKLEASAVVIYSYYSYSSAEAKKVTDNQKWVYTDEGGVKAWKLKSLLPEFR
jgi:hypothetical protein